MSTTLLGDDLVTGHSPIFACMLGLVSCLLFKLFQFIETCKQSHMYGKVKVV